MMRNHATERAVRVGGMGLIALLGLLSAVTPLSIDMYLPSLPTIAEQLQASSSLVQISVSMFFSAWRWGSCCTGRCPIASGAGRRWRSDSRCTWWPASLVR